MSVGSSPSSFALSPSSWAHFTPTKCGVELAELGLNYIIISKCISQEYLRRSSMVDRLCWDRP